MAEKKTTVKNGEKFVSIAYGPGLLDRIRSGISDLARRVFYYTPEEERVTVSVTRTLDGYIYDADYGKSKIPFQARVDLVSKLQESGKEILGKNPDKTVVEAFSEHHYFDPLGLMRLRRYLAN